MVFFTFLPQDVVAIGSVRRARGRLGVLSYWAQSGLLTILGALVAGIIAAVAYGLSGGPSAVLEGADPSTPIDAEALIPTGIAGLVILPILLLVAYIGICLIIKRLHDLNLSGWWSLLLLIPLLGVLFSLYVFLWPGKDNNRYGAPRPTRGWEKVLGVLFLALSLITVVSGIYIGVTEQLSLQSSESIEQSTRATHHLISTTTL